MYYSFILLLSISTLFTIINRKYLKLPATIGILLLGMFLSISLLGFKLIDPKVYEGIPHILRQINFHDFLMNIILGFLLFAGGLHVNLKALEKEKWSVFLFAVFGTAISTVFIGIAGFYIFQLIGVDIPLLYCLLFGSLISPTDPIAVLSIFKNYNIDKSLSIKIEGESLFNDGIGIVFFLTTLSIIQADGQDFSFTTTALLFAREAIGGIFFGWLMGMIAQIFLKQTQDDAKTAVMVTLVLVMGGWALADFIEVSAALAMVTAGITVGQWIHHKSPEELKKLAFTFWDIMDEIFNNTLFVLMGLAIILIDPAVISFKLAATTILIVLVARMASVSLPIFLMNANKKTKGNKNFKLISILTWSGLRGALAFALALSLQDMPYGHTIIFLTYSVAAFSIIVQGLSVGKLLKHFGY